MSVKVSISELRKTFIVSHSGIASIKSLLLFWRKRSFVTLEVLKGVSFEVNGGECVAVIGKNGAGKSTLLSLLAKIYLPTSGKVEVLGRVAPLLELGAGFHNDLTGLENIYFNAVILGLTREQVKERIQSIIDFSELGEAIEAPVRTYSSGMMARLGFAIAIHVDAEVLIVDEVLAVGDQRFEQKCLERVEEFRRNGGAILLVSHQLPTVEKFADRVVWLKDGKIEMIGKPAEVIAEYVARG